MNKFKVGDKVIIKSCTSIAEVIDTYIHNDINYYTCLIHINKNKEYYVEGMRGYKENELEYHLSVQQVFKDWCKQTKRSGGVLVGSSIQEFLRELQAKVDER